MTVYLLLWLAVYGVIGAVVVRAITHRLAAALLVLVLGFFAVVRGNVGPDTVAIYQAAAHSLLADGFGASHFEPGFRALLYGLVCWTDSAQLAVRGIALTFTILLLSFASTANRAESWFLLALFIPAFFLAVSFSGERIGVAYAVLLLSVRAYRLGRPYRWKALYWGSLLFHYSSLVVLIYTLLVESRFRARRFVATAATSICVTVLLAYFLQAYVLSKYTAYALSGYESPNALSGLSQIAIVVVILAGLRHFRINRQLRRRILWVTITFCIIFWIIARYSYAGLRLLDLMAFALPYSLVRAIARGDAVLTQRAKGVFVLAGLIGTVFLFRNMIMEQKMSISPFIPYYFIWQ